MNQRMSAAQLRQQNNRDRGGRYAEQQLADPGYLSLGSLDLAREAARGADGRWSGRLHDDPGDLDQILAEGEMEPEGTNLDYQAGSNGVEYTPTPQRMSQRDLGVVPPRPRNKPIDPAADRAAIADIQSKLNQYPDGPAHDWPVDAKRAYHELVMARARHEYWLAAAADPFQAEDDRNDGVGPMNAADVKAAQEWLAQDRAERITPSFDPFDSAGANEMSFVREHRQNEERRQSRAERGGFLGLFRR